MAERLGPVLDRVETWETDGGLLPGVDVRLAPGHTPGSSVVVISDGTQRALLLGDIIHCPLELMDDDFNLLVDHDQAMADSVREAYARAGGRRRPGCGEPLPGAAVRPALAGQRARAAGRSTRTDTVSGSSGPPRRDRPELGHRPGGGHGSGSRLRSGPSSLGSRSTSSSKPQVASFVMVRS